MEKFSGFAVASLPTSSEDSEFYCHDIVVTPSQRQVKAVWAKKVIPDDTVGGCCREMLLNNSTVLPKRQRSEFF